MGRSESSTAADYYPNASASPNELPEHTATVAPFALDKYEVTVGRFREFVASYDTWHSSHPTTGEGSKRPADGTGWGDSWAVVAENLPANAAELKAAVACDAAFETWLSTPGANDAEAYPINCVDWFLAFAFCIWDGGRLPTEAEWEYVAAGGPQNLRYPWGGSPPSSDLANFSGSGEMPRLAVGSKLATGGAGYFGHADLAGSVCEWVFDWYADSYYGSPGSPVTCNNCANTTAGNARVFRGGGWSYMGSELRSARRTGIIPSLRDDLLGIRCARAVK
jgi:formylglycine-generating enzyme required for sulfatase activity